MPQTPPRRRPVRPWMFVLGGFVLAVAVLVAIWDWDWFIPVVDRIASARLGRAVTLQHLHVRIARNPVIEADGLRIANPDGFPAQDGQDFATADALTVSLDGPAFVRRRAIVLPVIGLRGAHVNPTQLDDNRNNWTIALGGAQAGQGGAPGVQIGDLRISDSQVHAVLARLKADFVLDVSTRAPGGRPTAPVDATAGTPADASADSQLVADAHGTYAGQKVTGQFVGGALLTLRDATHPYPIDLKLQNGPTTVSLAGTVQDPLAFKGADVKLALAGPDLAKLTPLTGIPLPETPAYKLAGQLDYEAGRIRFRDFAGTVGKSDLEGTIAVDPAPQRPQVQADLHSRRVDLADLGGFIGAAPGNTDARTATPQQRAETKRAAVRDKVLPDAPLNLPKLQFADVDLKYRGEHIEGRSMPLDKLIADMTIKDGAVSLHPLNFTVGTGDIESRIDLAPQAEHALHAKVDVTFRRVDVARLLAATHTFNGAGRIGGHADIDGTGSSVAGILGTGNGSLRLYMAGGNLSALLVDLSGLEFGNAVLSAIGVPRQTQVECLLTDFALRRGVLAATTFLIDTKEARVTAGGTINMHTEGLDLAIKTEPKHFSIGSLPGPIDIVGTMASPAIRPSAETAARVGVAAGVGVLLTPLGALLPTIQFGVDDDGRCAAALRPVAQAAPARR